MGFNCSKIVFIKTTSLISPKRLFYRVSAMSTFEKGQKTDCAMKRLCDVILDPKQIKVLVIW